MAAKPTTHKHKTAAELPPNLQHTNTKQRQNCRQTYQPGATQTNDNKQNSGKTATIVSHKPTPCTRTKFVPFFLYSRWDKFLISSVVKMQLWSASYQVPHRLQHTPCRRQSDLFTIRFCLRPLQFSLQHLNRTSTIHMAISAPSGP